ncbi:single-pass membrane and coiled-coil domain-containing protein 4 homolog [Bemisia tabaci]|uniref:single-pass membrane and coiled-coil domain-containing protein 4 homolog n=1 Tax=Bemisia tabaci TaxID=7038 RepID=UPI0008F9D77B|nr:PREDICTED: single-pass membrane and coiled-coil domain-containing protein 4 homolog [Bemisia tabaci]
MRTLKGKPKETGRQKRERKKEFLENKKNIMSVVVPTLCALGSLLILFIYYKTRPRAIPENMS